MNVPISSVNTTAIHHSGKAAFGFTLIEIAVVLTIMGIILGSGIMAADAVIDNYRINKTRSNMERAADALSLFIEQNLFIPCPASPDAPASTAGTPRAACGLYNTSNTGAIGIVPYREIGLRPETMMDAYGHPLTYIINPAFNQQAVTGQTTVHNVCRVRSSWVNPQAQHHKYLGDPTKPNEEDNRYPSKAVFCCPDYNVSGRTIDLDPIIQNQNGTTIAPRRTNTGGTGAVMADPITKGGAVGYPNSVPPYGYPDTKIHAVGFILISHGRNGHGAFMMNGTAGRINNAQAGPLERINATSGNIYVDAPEDAASGDYFDDLLLWRTPDQALMSMGRNTCATP